MKVIAFEVDHGDVIKPCYGYRIEYGGRVAVFSSDTRYNQNVIKYGKGADLLVHEVAMARPELMKEAYIQRIIGHHTTPRRLRPRVRADQAEARRLHPCRAARQRRCRRRRSTRSSPRCDRPTTDRCEVGEDLMSFEIGETVTVKRHPSRSPPKA